MSGSTYDSAGEEKPRIKAQLLAEVEFGMPSKKCNNFGICRIIPTRLDGRFKHSQDRKSKAVTTIFYQNYVELDFLKQSLSQKTYDLFFSGKSFLVKECFEFIAPGEEGLSFLIPKGEYDIEENNTLIKVIFK
jgi:hypothetical protein